MHFRIVHTSSVFNIRPYNSGASNQAIGSSRLDCTASGNLHPSRVSRSVPADHRGPVFDYPVSSPAVKQQSVPSGPGNPRERAPGKKINTARSYFRNSADNSNPRGPPERTNLEEDIEQESKPNISQVSPEENQQPAERSRNSAPRPRQPAGWVSFYPSMNRRTIYGRQVS